MIITKNQLEYYISKGCPADYSILVHGSGCSNMEEARTLENSITQKGLRLNGSMGLVSTAVPLGLQDEYDINVVWNHTWNKGMGTFVTAVIAVPQVFEYSDGEKHFVGKYAKSSKQSADNKDDDNYTESSIPIDGTFRKNILLPPEFVLCCFTSIDKEHVEFVPNPLFIAFRKPESIQRFFDSIREGVKGSININTSSEEINKYIAMCKEVGLNTSLYKQFLEYKEKLKNR